jgi:hypothetical protein
MLVGRSRKFMSTTEEERARRDALLAMEVASEALTKLSAANYPAVAAGATVHHIADAVISARNDTIYAELIIAMLQKQVEEWKAEHPATIQ